MGGSDGTAAVTAPAIDGRAFGLDCTRPDTCAVSLSSGEGGDPLVGSVAPVGLLFVE